MGWCGLQGTPPPLRTRLVTHQTLGAVAVLCVQPQLPEFDV